MTTMIAAERIAEVLGLKRKIHSFGDLSRAVQHGLPKTSLRAAVARVALTPSEQHQLIVRLIPEATYKRRKEFLKPEESERTERLARVIATAEYVWDDPDDARAFLRAPHSLLGGRRPIDAALTELGAREVEELLWKLFYGAAA